MVDALRSERSTLYGYVSSTLTLGTKALVAQRIERSPAKAEVVGSIPAKRAIKLGKSIK